jgi:hypothetical protein
MARNSAARLATALALTVAVVVSLPSPAVAERPATTTEKRTILKDIHVPFAATTCLRIVVSTVNARYAALFVTKACVRFKDSDWYKADRYFWTVLWDLPAAHHWVVADQVPDLPTPPKCPLLGVPTPPARDLGVCR